MSQPTPASSAREVDTPPERLHPLTPVVKGWVGLLALVFFGGRSWLENGGRFEFDHLSWWAWILLAALLVSVVAGFISWRATSYRLDADALRLETRFIWNSSTVVNYSKIQSIDIVAPFAARLVGVCGLRLDVGGGAPQKLEFLGRSRAEALRDELVGRAALVRSETWGTAPTDAPGDDESPERVDDVVVSVPPGRLVAAVVTSHDFLWAVLFAALALVPSIVTSTFAFAGLVVPAVWGLAALVLNRVVKEWNYRLHAPEPSVVRVARGLTDTVSQTVPVERVQGIELSQSWWWRRWGWWRVRFAVLGYAGDEADEGGSTVLLPVGTWDEVTRVLRAVWPEVDLDALDWQPLPRRARWLHPLDWRQRGWAVSEQVVADRSGRLQSRLSVVARSRMQARRVSQGPLERRLGLAGFSVQISGSVVDVNVSGVDPAVARQWVRSVRPKLWGGPAKP
ncbi:PH domain-containing protein [Aestuariimicrobium soli]|uniref:PH domain-containing protein n=1 Tax=Aestuariimicrobium soli TaxID=2035834 RepID=UPI003EBC424C